MRINQDYDDPLTENHAWASELRGKSRHGNPPDFLDSQKPKPETEKQNVPIETETK